MNKILLKLKQNKLISIRLIRIEKLFWGGGELISWLKPKFTFTNILLIAILSMLFTGFYYSSPDLRGTVSAIGEIISSIGWSNKSEKVGLADLICKETVDVPLSEKESKRLSELDNKLMKSSSEFQEELDLTLFHKRETKAIDRFEVIRDREYRFGFVTSERYHYRTNTDTLDCDCKSGINKNKMICNYKAYDKPISF